MPKYKLQDNSHIIDDIEQLRIALDNVPVYVYIKDKESRYLYANKLTLKLFGCSSEELTGRGDSYFFPPDTVLRLREVDLRVLNGESTQEEIVVTESNGEQHVYLEVKTPVYEKPGSETIVALLGISTDITLQKQMEKVIRQLALTDPLTNLPNRRRLFERIAQALQRSKRYNTFGAILFIDLNEFKQVNDTYGHEKGDQLLIAIANRLQKQVREIDTIARIGGDEFVLLLEEIGSEEFQALEYVSDITERIEKVLSHEYTLGEVKLLISASIGIQLFLGDTLSASELVSKADADMYKKKRCSQ